MGIWTHTPPEKEISEKTWILRGLNRGPLGWQSKTLPLSYEGFLYNNAQKTIKPNIPKLQF